MLEAEKKETELALHDAEEQLLAVEIDLHQEKSDGDLQLQERCRQYEEELKVKREEIDALKNEGNMKEIEMEKLRERGEAMENEVEKLK